MGTFLIYYQVFCIPLNVPQVSELDSNRLLKASVNTRRKNNQISLCKLVAQANIYIFNHVIGLSTTCCTPHSGVRKTEHGSLWRGRVLASHCQTAGDAADGVGGRPKEWRMGLLCSLPVDGMIKLLHLLVGEDTVGEVRLELLQGQLPII